MTITLLAAQAPSPLWYATRSAGVVSLLLLTAVMLLGIATTARLGLSSRWKFILHGLHRNLSLVAVVFLAIHVLAAVFDPYARLGWKDALVPFVSSYRPLYMGLGVLSMEVSAAVVITALTQRWIGRRLFRLVHWAAYASWPVAVVHSLGTGSDVRAWWFYLVLVACIAAVMAVLLAWRLLRGEPATARFRIGAGAASLLGLAVLGAWTFTGPLRPGWALASGTPADLVRSRATTPNDANPPLPGSLNDGMRGTLVRSGAGFTISLADLRDPSLVMVIVGAGEQPSIGTVTISRSGHQLCRFQADLSNPLTGSCGSTQLSVQLATGRGGLVVGRLSTAGSGGVSQ